MIVFPMAGLSQRFADKGYKVPKFCLPVHGLSVFRHVISGFSALFETRDFLFVFREDPETAHFIERECEALGLGRRTLAPLSAATRGQAETVLLGIERAGMDDAAPLTIFNIDTFRPGFAFPAETGDGYLEVFKGSGANWSYVRPGAEGRVLETAEKVAISDLCCTGLYHFRMAGAFRDATRAALASYDGREIYVAPLYNRLIAAGADIRYHEIPRTQVIFCGTPEEYEALIR